MYHPIVRQESISQEKWIDYIFSAAPKIVSNLLSSDVWKRQKAYQMNMIQQEPWFYTIQRLKWFRMMIRGKKNISNWSQIVLNETDLMGEPWSDQDSQIDIHTKQGIIRYSMQDLIGILMSSLESRDEFSPNSSIPKHPYTNTEWTLGEMYAIQGWMRKISTKANDMPLSVMAWIKTPYVVYTIPTSDSKPYILHEYLLLQSKYNYLLENEDRMLEEQELRQMCCILTIQSERINWDKVEMISSERWNMLIRPFIMRWNHPMSEWMIDETSSLDSRTIHWKNDLFQILDTLGCVQRLQTRPRRIYRRRRIGIYGSIR